MRLVAPGYTPGSPMRRAPLSLSWLVATEAPGKLIRLRSLPQLKDGLTRKQQEESRSSSRSLKQQEESRSSSRSLEAAAGVSKQQRQRPLVPVGREQSERAEAEGDTAYILTLDEGLLHKICACLALNDLLSACTCRQLNSLIATDKDLWRSLFIPHRYEGTFRCRAPSPCRLDLRFLFDVCPILSL